MDMESLRGKYHTANTDIANLRMSLDESRSNEGRLHKESELVVENVDVWVKEQK